MKNILFLNIIGEKKAKHIISSVLYEKSQIEKNLGNKVFFENIKKDELFSFSEPIFDKIYISSTSETEIELSKISQSIKQQFPKAELEIINNLEKVNFTKEDILLIDLAEKGKDPDKHRKNLALARLSTIEKLKGNNPIYHLVGNDINLPLDISPTRIYISVVFSFNCPLLVKLIDQIKIIYNLKDTDIIIGGVCTSHMYDYIKANTGITPLTMCDKILDHVIPDSNIYKGDDSTYIFTMRSCFRKCSWCVVSRIEPDFYVIKNWKQQLNLNAKTVFIGDNNPLSAPKSHKEDIFKFLAEIAPSNGKTIPGTKKIRKVVFDGGLDFRLLNKENLELLKNINFDQFRLAFDSLDYDLEFEKAANLITKYYPKTNFRGKRELFRVYILYNSPHTKDTIVDTLYRIYKVWNVWGFLPFPMRYQPLDTLEKNSYISPYWTKEECSIGRWANSRTIFMTKQRYGEFWGTESVKIEGVQVLNRKTGKTHPLRKQIFKDLPDNYKYLLEEIPKMENFDFTKGFEYNKPLIEKELEVRKRIIAIINDLPKTSIKLSKEEIEDIIRRKGLNIDDIIIDNSLNISLEKEIKQLAFNI